MSGENYIMMSFMICTPYQMSFGLSNQGHVACMVERRGMYGVVVGKPEGKRPLRRP
jgi:hypothetical protein